MTFDRARMPLGDRFLGILEAAKHGEEWAWALLYRSLAGQVAGYLAGRGAAEPEDIASEVFLQIARGIHEFKGDEAAFRSWVFVIAHRRLIDERRRRGRRPAVSEEPVESVPEPEGGDVEDEALERLGEAEMRRALAQLSDGQRDVLALRIIADLSLEDTAMVLGKRVGAVKSMQLRALDALHRILAAEGVTR